MMRSDSAIEACRREYARIRRDRDRLRTEDDDIQMQIRDMFADLHRREEELVCGDYSRAVYDRYAKIQPWLRSVPSGKAVRWRDAFGTAYEKTTPEQRHALVGLIEGGGSCRFLNPFRRIPYLRNKKS